MSSERTSVQYKTLLFFRTLLGVGVRGVREGNRIISTIGNRKGGKAPFLSRPAETEYRTQLGYGGGPNTGLLNPLFRGPCFPQLWRFLARPLKKEEERTQRLRSILGSSSSFQLSSLLLLPLPLTRCSNERTKEEREGRKDVWLRGGRFSKL